MSNLSTALNCHASKHKVLVVRNAFTRPDGTFEEVVRPFVGSAPMECQSECRPSAL